MADMMYGWVGKIAKIDLTTRKVETVPTSNYVPKFIGGRALAAKLYWDEVPPQCAAFDPENRLIFASGPVSGTMGPGSARTAIATKSPYTIPECYQTSVTGGSWSAELKFAGLDALVITGKAKEPVYLWIHDGQIEIKKAERLWGMLTSQADTELRRLWGDKTRSMLIGPAGENLVKTAAIIVDVSHGTGLGGFGAVMGSKNLKAIAVRGASGVKVAKPKDLLNVYNDYVKIGGKFGGPYPVSTPSYFAYHQMGAIKNAGAPADIVPVITEDIDASFNEEVQWSKAMLDSEEVKAGTVKRKFEGCLTCPACCGYSTQPTDPSGSEPKPKDLSVPPTVFQQCLEIQTQTPWEAAAFGGRIRGRPSQLHNASVSDLGLSAIPMLGSQSWFNEAVKAGLLTKENTGLPCGDMQAYNTEAMLGAAGYTYGIAYKRNDFFKAVAEGTLRYLADKAKSSPQWKAIYDAYTGLPRFHMNWTGSAGSKTSQYILYEATGFRYHPNEAYYHFSLLPSSPNGGKTLCGFVPQAELVNYAKANRARYASLLGPKSYDLVAAGETQTLEGKVTATVFFQNMQIEMDSLPYCGWAGFPKFYSIWTSDHLGDPSGMVKILAAVTGIDRSWDEDVRAMEAVATLERAIHAREGRRREDDVYSDGVFKSTTWTTKADFNKALDDYYKTRGWDVKTGIPPRAQLEKLGLKDVADDLEKKYGVPVSV